jgi:hypothetical protein
MLTFLNQKHMQKPNKLQVAISDEEKRWLSILKNKYRIKQSQFIRDAIKEKLQRDTPRLRLELKKNNERIPF